MGFYGGQETVDPKTADPLFGEEAKKVRTEIFNALPSVGARAQAGAERAAGAATQASGAYGPVMDYGRSVLAGNYLNASPQLNRALASSRAASNTAAQAQQAEARANLANQQAATRAQFGRAGQTFGTTNQLAQGGNTAALEAQLGRSEAARLAQQQATQDQVVAENYGRERQLQQQAPGMINMAATQPVALLQSVPQIEYSALGPAVDITRGLSAGQASSANYYKPGVGDYALQGLGALGAAGGAGFP